MTKHRKKPDRLPYVALVLAYLIPGAGHVYVGRVTRGAIIFVTIGALFWSGVAVGGVMTMDAKRERWWFVAQMFTGVHGLIGWRRQQHRFEQIRYEEVVRDCVDESPERRLQKINVEVDRRLREKGIVLVAPADTVARAYAGVAGLLNLMCIFDAVLLSVMGVTGEPPPENETAMPPGGKDT